MVFPNCQSRHFLNSIHPQFIKQYFCAQQLLQYLNYIPNILMINLTLNLSPLNHANPRKSLPLLKYPIHNILVKHFLFPHVHNPTFL